MDRGRPPRRRLFYFLEAPLRRPKLLLVPAVLVATAASAIALLLPPRYRAAALLQAEWEAADEALLRQRGIDLDSRRSQAVRQRVTEPALLEQALEEAKPYAPAGGPAFSRDEQVERLLADLRVRPVTSSSFVIEYVHRDPATAALVPNLIATRLAAGVGDARAGQAPTLLETRLAEARQVMEEQAAAPEDEAAFAEKRAVAAALTTARARAERLRQAVEAERRAGKPVRPEDELERMRGELAELRKRYTEEHPDVERLRRRVLRLEASLPASPEPPTPQAELREAEAEIADLVDRESRLEAATARPPLKPEPRQPDRQQATLGHERARRAYETLLEEWRAAETAARSSRGPIARLELLRRAARPETAESPDRLVFGLAGALVGLLIGLGAAFVAEHRDRSVKGPEDLAAILEVPLLATLPEVRVRGRHD